MNLETKEQDDVRREALLARVRASGQYVRCHGCGGEKWVDNKCLRCLNREMHASGYCESGPDDCLTCLRMSITGVAGG